MKINHLSKMTKGWFVGNFVPCSYRTHEFEVAVKHYRSGDCEEWHYHKIATEITVVVSGEVEMNSTRFRAGDIIILEPMEGTNFEAITDTITVVVKTRSVKDDKYSKES